MAKTNIDHPLETWGGLGSILDEMKRVHTR